jgi:hypothetical protein
MDDFIYIEGAKYKVIKVNRYTDGVNEPVDVYELVE